MQDFLLGHLNLKSLKMGITLATFARNPHPCNERRSPNLYSGIKRSLLPEGPVWFLITTRAGPSSLRNGDR